MSDSVEALERIAKGATEQRALAVKLIHQRLYGEAQKILQDLDKISRIMEEVLHKKDRNRSKEKAPEAIKQPQARGRKKGQKCKKPINTSRLISLEQLHIEVLRALDQSDSMLSPKAISEQVEKNCEGILTQHDLALIKNNRTSRLTSRIYTNKAWLKKQGYITCNEGRGKISLWEITDAGRAYYLASVTHEQEEVEDFTDFEEEGQ